MTGLHEKLWLDDDPLTLLALAIWREREARLPKFTRRDYPEVMDSISGAWQRCLDEAKRRGRDAAAEADQARYDSMVW